MSTIVNVWDNQDFTYKVSWKSDQFHTVLEDARSSGMKWKPNEKVWEAGQQSCLFFLEAVKEYASIFPRGIYEKVKNNIPPPERYDLKIPFKKNLLKRKPLPSKNGGVSFQVEDIISGISSNVFALFLEQGMGKSFIALSVLNHLMEFAGVTNALIVCEPTGIYNWRRYILEDTTGVERDDILIVTKDNREKLGVSNYKITICSFGTFRLCLDFFNKGRSKNPRKPVIPFKGDSKNWALFVDESQNIGNVASRQTKAVLAHKKLFGYRYLLSGTPAINSPLKYYSQMKLLDDTIFNMDYQTFKNKIAYVGTRNNPNVITGYNEKGLVWLYDQMSPVVSMRKSEDYLDLPDHVVKKIYCEFTSEHEEIYNTVLSSNLKRIKEIDGYLDARKVYNKFPYFHLSLDNPLLLEGIEEDQLLLRGLKDKIKRFSLGKNHGKVLMLKELLLKYIDENSNKVVVWSGHPKTIDALVQIFAKYNPKYIHGQINGGDNEYRDFVIESWKADENSKLLILSYLTSSTSINLTQASHQIFFDRSYDAVYYDQAMKRLHRTGQNKDVRTDILLFDDTLDLRLDKNLEEKSNIDSLIFKQGKVLTAEQWQDIFYGKGL